jgi:hypothetical protein
VETKMGCGNQHKVFVGVEGLYDETRAIEGCDACVVPVLGSSPGEANASHYEQLISNGFLMIWDASDPPPVASKFAHPSNHLSIKYLAKTSSSFGFPLTWDGTLVNGN